MPAFRTTKPSTDADADAKVIAGLRSRLAHAETLNHPDVRCELRKLDELLIGLLDQPAHNPGRHRSPLTATAS